MGETVAYKGGVQRTSVMEIEKTSTVESRRTATSSNISLRVTAVEELMRIFHWERMIHVWCTGLSAAALLFSMGYVMFKYGPDPWVLVPLIGPTGLMTYSTNRLLRMFDQAVLIIRSADDE